MKMTLSPIYLWTAIQVIPHKGFRCLYEFVYAEYCLPFLDWHTKHTSYFAKGKVSNILQTFFNIESEGKEASFLLICK